MLMFLKKQKKMLLFVLAVVFLTTNLSSTANINAEVNVAAIPDRIVQSFYGDAQTQKGFSWYVSVATENQVIQYVQAPEIIANANLREEEVANIDFSNASVVKAKVKKVSNNFGEEYFCTATVKKLLPGTSYYYRVGDLKTNTWSRVSIFSTDKKDKEEFTFLHVTDTQANNESEYNVSRKTIKAALKDYPESKFVVCTGDFVNEATNEQQWKLALNMFDSFDNLSLVPITGNHDSDDWKFIEHFNLEKPTRDPMRNGAYYSFNYGNAHFTIINSNTSAGLLDVYQDAWLEKDLATNDTRWKIVMMHHSIFSDSYHRDDSDIKMMRKTLTKLFTKYKVDMVLSGHDHVYLRTVPMNGYKPGDAQYIEIDENGNKVQYEKYSGNTTYIINRSSGVKTYYVHYDNGVGRTGEDYTNNPIIFPASNDSRNLSSPVFSAVKVGKDRLVYKGYVVNKSNLAVSEIDSYGVIKDKNHTYKKDVTYKTNAKTVLYKSSKLKGRKLLNLKSNVKVSVLKKTAKKFKVKVKGKVGYIRANDITAHGIWFGYAKKAISSKSKISGKSKTVKKFVKGQKIVYTQQIGNFGKADNNAGWINLKYLRK